MALFHRPPFSSLRSAPQKILFRTLINLLFVPMEAQWGLQRGTFKWLQTLSKSIALKTSTTLISTHLDCKLFQNFTWILLTNVCVCSSWANAHVSSLPSGICLLVDFKLIDYSMTLGLWLVQENLWTSSLYVYFVVRLETMFFLIL